MKRAKYSMVFFALFLAGYVYPQENKSLFPLFDTDKIFEMKLSMNVKEVIRDKEERKYHKARLTYKLPDGRIESQKLRVKVRGKTRTNPSVCKFPPIRLNFGSKKSANTLFEGQNKLKLVTHCGSKSINEEYILREYYVYKAYQLVTPSSFKVRLCSVTYQDTEGNYEESPHYGIIIESIEDLAQRNGKIVFEDSIRNQDVCDRATLDKLMFFEYMIGNLDWSISHGHNMKIISNANKSAPIAIPYDFDFSGIVNTSYAQPPPSIDIPSVKVRVFRGLCRQKGGYLATSEFFQDIKPDIYKIYEQSEYLSDISRKRTLKYLDEFYKIVGNPKMLNNKIAKACRANHKHLFQY